MTSAAALTLFVLLSQAGATELGRVRVGGGAFVISSSACEAGEARIQVSFTRGENQSEPFSDSLFWPGECVWTPQDDGGWSSGEESSSLSVRATPVSLSQSRPALLLFWEGGFEHVKRRYDLLSFDGERVHRLWEHTEGAGPERSWVKTFPASGGGEGVVLQRILPNPDPQTHADEVEWETVVWDDNRRTLHRSSRGQVQAVILGSRRTLKDARAFERSLSEECPSLQSGTVVIGAKSWPKLTKGVFAVAQLVATPEEATRALKRAHGCALAKDAYKKRLR